MMLKIVKNGQIVSQSKVRNADLKVFADKLNVKLPKSEQWFMQVYEPYRITIKFPIRQSNRKSEIERYKDKYNQPFMGFIPDIINYGFKYIIEVDGSIHKLDKVNEKDCVKQALYEHNGYKVFRIEAYNQESLELFKKEYKEYIESKKHA